MIIVRAAIMYSNGDILVGRDYSSIMNLAHQLGVYGEKIDGFITSSDKFVLPAEAAIIAMEAGQIDELIDELVPEQLWPLLTV